MAHQQGKRGGARSGAGRPKGTSKLYTFRADHEVAAFLDKQENKTAFILDCVSKEMQTQLRPWSPDEAMPTIGEVLPASRVKPLSLPFFDIRIVAGFPIPLTQDEVAQDVDLLRMLCPHPDSSYLIRVVGDSMIDAGIADGDILVVDKSNRSPSDKQIAVCELNGEYTVKRVVADAEGRWLVPANPDYPRIEITDGDQFSVWGVVTFVIHQPRG